MEIYIYNRIKKQINQKYLTILIFFIFTLIISSCVSYENNKNLTNVQSKHIILEDKTIAVLPFENTGLESFECEALSLFFENSIINNNSLNLLERNQIDKVLETYKLSYSGLIEEESSNEIGNLLDAHYVILGNIGFFNGEYYISVKIIEVETGLNVGAAKHTAPTVDSLVNNLDNVVSELFGNEVKIETNSEKPQVQIDKKCYRTWIKYALKGNQAYDKDNYESSYMFYTYAIRNGCFDGLVWYRYAYSFEKLYGLSEITITNYRKALLLLSFQYTDNVYYQYAKNKIETYKG